MSGVSSTRKTCLEVSYTSRSSASTFTSEHEHPADSAICVRKKKDVSSSFLMPTYSNAGLRDMRQKADREVRDTAAAKASMLSIEARAEAQYKKDLKESEQAKKNLTGSWVRSLHELKQLL